METAYTMFWMLEGANWFLRKFVAPSSQQWKLLDILELILMIVV